MMPRPPAAAAAALFALAGAVAAADVWSKQWAVRTLKDAAPVEVAPFLRFVYVENTGAAFGILAGGGARWFLLAVALALCIGLAVFLWRSSHAGERLAAALIIGGAVGNMHDRLRLGYVVDFIDAHWGGYHWPAFNIADMAISCGAVWFAYLLVMEGRVKKSSSK